MISTLIPNPLHYTTSYLTNHWHVDPEGAADLDGGGTGLSETDGSLRVAWEESPDCSWRMPYVNGNCTQGTEIEVQHC